MAEDMQTMLARIDERTKLIHGDLSEIKRAQIAHEAHDDERFRDVKHEFDDIHNQLERVKTNQSWFFRVGGMATTLVTGVLIWLFTRGSTGS